MSRSFTVKSYGDRIHLVCYDSGYPVGGSQYPSYLMSEPFITDEGEDLGRDYGLVAATLDGRTFAEYGYLP